MAHDRKFRFAAQLGKAPEGTARSWADQARRAEALGYSTLFMPDHFGDQLAPVPALAAVAAATTTLRMGSLVFGNDYRHPVNLAKEAATLDVLSDGRFELSLGAGWMKTDYEEAGITYDTPKVRVERFEEAVAVLQGLLRTDGPFSFDGTLLPGPRPRPPAPPGADGPARRSSSVAEASGCSPSPHATPTSSASTSTSGRAPAGPETAPNASPERTREKVAWVKEAAGDRFDDLELNALIGFVMITDDAAGIAEAMAPHFGIEPADALHIPLALLGTLDEMVEELQWRRQEYGISYWSIEADSWEALGPVVSKLSGT